MQVVHCVCEHAGTHTDKHAQDGSLMNARLSAPYGVLLGKVCGLVPIRCYHLQQIRKVGTPENKTDAPVVETPAPVVEGSAPREATLDRACAGLIQSSRRDTCPMPLSRAAFHATHASSGLSRSCIDVLPPSSS